MGNPSSRFLSVGWCPGFISQAYWFKGQTPSGNMRLVRRTGFRLSVLPLVKVFSGLVVHLFFLALAVLIFLVKDVSVSLTWIQVIYYAISMMFLMAGLCWFLASVSVFIPDVIRLIPVVVQIGFWVTPIFWNVEILSDKWQWIIKLNPVFYIINGYRDCFLENVWFWERPWLTIYFWAVTSAFMLLGAISFRKLRPHFAEVL